MTPPQGITTDIIAQKALSITINSYHRTFQETFMRLPEKQKELLVAIAKEGKEEGITSGNFIKKYKLLFASSVQAALKGLINLFLNSWIKQNYETHRNNNSI